jgi:peptidoglycan lytic transglycosylase A
MSRRTVLALALAAALLLGIGAWLAWHLARRPEEARLVLRSARFADLPGWRKDVHAEALAAWLRSCERIERLPPGEPLGGAGRAELAPDLARMGSAGEWQRVCAAGKRVPPGAARAFFERELLPFAAFAGREPTGLFTGYYEPLLHGSRRRHGRFTVPIYGRPPELVTVDLGLFREELRGQRTAGEVVEGALVPFADRAAVAAGALAGRDLEIAWVDDPVDAFFLEIQGSGRIELEEGGVLRVGYAAQNGRPYFAIGRDLVERGALAPEEVSLQSIRRWLAAHPEEAPKVMARNASYVFFQEVPGEGPLGAEGVVLTPGRSLAVDLAHLPLGVPVWLDGEAPAPVEGQPDRPLRRLLVAQDTVGAIRGPVRGDVFWGYGEAAAAVAGRMKHPGRIWLLLPRAVAARQK